MITELCVVDFGEEAGRERWKFFSTGGGVDQVRPKTGFDLIISESVCHRDALFDEEFS